MTKETIDHQSEQHVAVEIMAMTPCVRDDIQVTVQVYAGETCYILEDPISSKFFRLGLPEYTFVSLLDGNTTLAEAMGSTASIMGAMALNEREVGNLCKWLLDTSLATTHQSRTAGRLSESRSKESGKKLVAQANPMIQKLPLLNPMPILRRLDWLSRRMFSLLGAFVWLSVVGFGGYKVWADWDRFMHFGGALLAKHNWIWLIITWLALKLIHEASHAMACRRFGGNVRQAGIVFILLAPMPYVDVTSIWRMDSKWKRILISAAGLGGELFIAGIAAIIWAYSFDPLVGQHAVNVMVTATMVTILFNANPLMRFDGYYIMTDAIEMPNLASHGQQWLSYFMRRYFMGVDQRCPEWPEGRHWAVVAYAILSLLWRLVIYVSLAVTAEVLFHGAGVVIAVVSIATWVGIPLFRSIKTIRGNRLASRKRMCAITAAMAATFWCLWSFVPWYSRASVPIVVDYHPPAEIRVRVDGSLDENLVTVGDLVRAGEVLARLSNRELELQYEDLSLEIAQSWARARDYRIDGAIAAVEVEKENQAALQSRLSQIRDQLDGLTVIAPIDGIIASSDLEFREGTAVKAGDRLFVIGEKTVSRFMVWLIKLTRKPFAAIPESPSTSTFGVWARNNSEERFGVCCPERRWS